MAGEDVSVGKGNSINQFIPGMAGIAQGLAGNSGKPYQDASNTYQKYIDQAGNNFNPYIQGGQSAFGNMGNALNKMSDPQAFMKNIMSGYSQSPNAQFETQYGMQAQNNAASASGMLGSGASQKAAADYAQQVTSRDMQNYLQNILGVNSQYLQGLGQMSNTGMQGAQGMAGLYGDLGKAQAEAAYGKANQQQADQSSGIGGMFDIASKALPFFL